AQHEPELLAAWVEEQKAIISQGQRIKGQELRVQCAEFLNQFRKAAQGNEFADIGSPRWGEVRETLAGVSRSRSLQGFSPPQSAPFVFSLKKPLFALLRRELARDPELLVRETWLTTELLDKLGLFTTEVYQKSREEVIQRQQQEMLELSTPVVK